MLNKSYSYLIPLLNEYCKIDGDYYVMLDNVYTRHEDGDIGEIIILTYIYSDDEGFLSYIEELKANELCQDYILYEDTISIVFKFPDEYLDEYRFYRDGMFSKFSDKAKSTILKYILDIHKHSDATRAKRVLDRDIGLRMELENRLALKIDSDMELSSIPNAELETFYNK